MAPLHARDCRPPPFTRRQASAGYRKPERGYRCQETVSLPPMQGEQGFAEVLPEELPQERLANYNRDRNSKVFKKVL